MRKENCLVNVRALQSEEPNRQGGGKKRNSGRGEVTNMQHGSGTQ